MVIVRTARFNIKKFYVLLTRCIYVLVYGSQNTEIIRLHGSNGPVFINEMVCVYCAVRIDMLHKTD